MVWHWPIFWRTFPATLGRKTVQGGSVGWSELFMPKLLVIIIRDLESIPGLGGFSLQYCFP